MKDTDFVSMLKTAQAVPNYYKNKYPYNLGYFDGSRYSFDCWNLIKVVLAGWHPTGVVGSFTKPTVTGDITGLAMLKKCTNRSKDFSKLSVPGTYLYMNYPAHAGTFIGEQVVGGKVVNVIECTSSWRGGVQYSYVDANGFRYNYKGASKSRKWSEYGLLPWVEYTKKSSGYILNGLDYSPVFDPVFYSNNYADLKAAFGNDANALWLHFQTFGMNEFRQASKEFDPIYYQNAYADVERAFGGDRPMYYMHYVAFGKNEGRKGVE